MDINFNFEKGRFTHRSTGILILNNKILLETSDGVNFWSPPGGNVQFGESSQEAVIREFKEELNADIKISRLLWISEGFYEYANTDNHTIIMYYLIHLLNKNKLLDNDIFQRKDMGDHGTLMIFQWFPINHLENLIIAPQFLSEKLVHLSSEIEHIVERK